MVKVVGVHFENAGKLYYFETGDLWPEAGSQVVVETEQGLSLGRVITGISEVDESEFSVPLKPIVRIATEEDEAHQRENEAQDPQAFEICKQKIEEHQLDMKLIKAQFTLDHSKLLFFFTANGRVDFRYLVKDLASIFHVRIELRQVGVRDESKMLGGLGPCGRPICCSRFLGDFQAVGIRMAKEQNLSLNPTKISGACGRLMCCLTFEEENYEQTHRRMPRIGKEVDTPEGRGIVVDTSVVKEQVTVRFRKGDSFEQKPFPLDVITFQKEAELPEEEAEEASELPEERSYRREGSVHMEHISRRTFVRRGEFRHPSEDAPEGRQGSSAPEYAPRHGAPARASRFGAATPENAVRFGAATPEGAARFGAATPENAARPATAVPANASRFGAAAPEGTARPATAAPEGVSRPATAAPANASRFGAVSPEVAARPATAAPANASRFGAVAPEDTARPATAVPANKPRFDTASSENAPRFGAASSENAARFDAATSDGSARSASASAPENAAIDPAKAFVSSVSPNSPKPSGKPAVPVFYRTPKSYAKPTAPTASHRSYEKPAAAPRPPERKYGGPRPQRQEPKKRTNWMQEVEDALNEEE